MIHLIGEVRSKPVERSIREFKRKTIQKALQEKFVDLVGQIDPRKVSQQLYAKSLIGRDDIKKATNERNARSDRANDLALLIITKLNSMPEHFEDVCVALKNSGVAVIRDIQG